MLKVVSYIALVVMITVAPGKAWGGENDSDKKAKFKNRYPLLTVFKELTPTEREAILREYFKMVTAQPDPANASITAVEPAMAAAVAVAVEPGMTTTVTTSTKSSVATTRRIQQNEAAEQIPY